MKLAIAALAVVALAMTTGAQTAKAQRCESIGASMSGGWKPVSSAPRDGTTVEMLETYGVAPWYGIFKWTNEYDSEVSTIGRDGKITRTIQHIKLPVSQWSQVSRPEYSVVEDSCLFWRPYNSSSAKYVDPTGGKQDTVKYWCDHMGVAYDPKKDACKIR